MSSITSTVPAGPDPYRLGHRTPEGQVEYAGPASKRVIVGYGFWVFLLSDFVMFAGFFAAYAVLSTATAGGPSGRDIFNLSTVTMETACLLLSSFACGMASIAIEHRRGGLAQLWLIVTGILGAAFLFMEFREFSDLIANGNGPQRSAFLSSFFALVGCHGVHVTAGLVLLLMTMAQLVSRGFTPEVMRRFRCFSLFWHALDIIWVAVFTVVYLFVVIQ
jgi:cytochrome o ubiquinol oxidase subunit 3